MDGLVPPRAVVFSSAEDVGGHAGRMPRWDGPDAKGLGMQANPHEDGSSARRDRVGEQGLRGDDLDELGDISHAGGTEGCCCNVQGGGGGGATYISKLVMVVAAHPYAVYIMET
uniref:Uncharacterized protein n=1 Tax=Oryza punctata TaxID=4537 RepID=A0A0E0LKH3_ORYPU